MPLTCEQRAALYRVAARDFKLTQLAGDPVSAVLDTAPGNDEPFGGIKVITRSGWFAARPSGTEDVLKLYAESFNSLAHLRGIQDEATSAIARMS